MDLLKLLDDQWSSSSPQKKLAKGRATEPQLVKSLTSAGTGTRRMQHSFSGGFFAKSRSSAAPTESDAAPDEYGTAPTDSGAALQKSQSDGITSVSPASQVGLPPEKQPDASDVPELEERSEGEEDEEEMDKSSSSESAVSVPVSAAEGHADKFLEEPADSAGNAPGRLSRGSASRETTPVRGQPRYEDGLGPASPLLTALMLLLSPLWLPVLALVLLPLALTWAFIAGLSLGAAALFSILTRWWAVMSFLGWKRNQRSG